MVLFNFFKRQRLGELSTTQAVTKSRTHTQRYVEQ